MRSYRYDGLLSAHLEKCAGVAWQATKFVAPLVASAGATAATGIPIGRMGMPVAVGQAGMQAVNAMGGPGAIQKRLGKQEEARPVTASLREKGATYRLKSAEGHGLGATLAHMSPYAAWIAAKAIEDKNPALSKALSAGAYLGYAGAAGHDALTNPAERVTGAIDAVALAAMLGSDVMRWRRPSDH